MNFKNIISNNQFKPIINVALFAFLILGFHIFFRWWASDFAYWPLKSVIDSTYEFLANLLYNNSVCALKHLTTYEFTTDTSLREIYMGSGYVGVNHGCSGLKQFLQWIVLMGFFPGPWKHKAWFIPAGLVVIHLVNIFRISSLSVYLVYNPPQTTWDFAHDWILRPFFYVIIFAMWVVWVEKFVEKK